MKLRDLAEQLQCRVENDRDDVGGVEITRVAGIDQAQAGDVTFVDNPRYVSHLSSTQASAVIVSEDLAVPSSGRFAVLRSRKPYVDFARAVALFIPSSAPARGIDRLSAVAPDATIGADVSIGPFVSIGPGASIGARTVLYSNVSIGAGATVGDDCVIHSQTSIRERAVVGNRVILHDGVVIGSEGFGFAKQADGTHLKIPQAAGVVVEDVVEIGANSTIDRPAVCETRIQAGTKIDNLVHVAHGVSVGRRVLLMAQVGISGSAVVEDDVILAGQVGVAGHLRIGKGAMATAQSGIPNSVEPGEYVSGSPAIPHRDWMKSAAAYRQLPALRKRVAELEHRLAELQEKLKG
jgi:UDP-3-O-[3-hydroxymyristoyl] glucosamine N-acyltransferase